MKTFLLCVWLASCIHCMLYGPIRQAVEPGPNRKLAGVVLGGVSRDRPEKTFLQPLGSVSFNSQKPITEDTVMWIASITKLFATVAALQCVEAGIFSLDSLEDVKKFVPELLDLDIIKSYNVENTSAVLGKASRPPTLRELITHTNGMSYDFVSPAVATWRASRNLTFPTGVNGIPPIVNTSRIPLAFEPGTSWEYSIGGDWVGKMIERATNMKLEEFMRQRIFNPLRMTSTTFAIADRLDLEARRMPIYQKVDGKYQDTKVWWGKGAHNPDDYGSSGLYSTPRDCLKLLRSLTLNDGALLKPYTVKTMFETNINNAGYKALNLQMSATSTRRLFAAGLADNAKWSHGLGGMLTGSSIPGKLSKGSLFWFGAANAHWFIDPKGGHGGLFFTSIYPLSDPELEPLKSVWYTDMRKDLAVGKRANPFL